MNLLADESVDRPIVDRLRAESHDVLYIADRKPGMSDISVLASAKESQVLLVTGDKDFGELVFRQGLVDSGVVLLRLAGLSSETKSRIVVEVLRDHGNEMLNAFSVISPASIRIRHRI